MKIRVSIFIVILLMSGILNVTAEIDIPDPSLRAEIEEALDKQAGNPITAEEMATLTRLTARGYPDITYLTGLEHATNLTLLIMNHNEISDISPLAGLTKLEILYFYENQISDISALAGLTKGNVSVIIVSDDGEFKIVTQANDDGDVLLTGGQSFILTAREPATVAISGDGLTSTCLQSHCRGDVQAWK
jgi:Leucine-rich repeat (LRR) protein